MAVRLMPNDNDRSIPEGPSGETVEQGKRKRLGSELRSRFGFSLFQAPMRKPGDAWLGQFDQPEQGPVPAATPQRTPRPRTFATIEEQLELGLLGRGHLARSA